MKTVTTAALWSSPLLSFGALKLLGSSEPGQWSGIADDFLSPRFWLTVCVMLTFGAFGGISYELLLRKGAIELPHRAPAQPVHSGGRKYTHAAPETLIVLGTVGRAIVGATAAMAVLIVVAPSTGQSAIALAVTSGACAPALIRLMKKQLLFAADALSRFNADARPADSHDEPEPMDVRKRGALSPVGQPS